MLGICNSLRQSVFSVIFISHSSTHLYTIIAQFALHTIHFFVCTISLNIRSMTLIMPSMPSFAFWPEGRIIDKKNTHTHKNAAKNLNDVRSLDTMSALYTSKHVWAYNICGVRWLMDVSCCHYWSVAREHNTKSIPVTCSRTQNKNKQKCSYLCKLCVSENVHGCVCFRVLSTGSTGVVVYAWLTAKMLAALNKSGSTRATFAQEIYSCGITYNNLHIVLCACKARKIMLLEMHSFLRK